MGSYRCAGIITPPTSVDKPKAHSSGNISQTNTVNVDELDVEVTSINVNEKDIEVSARRTDAEEGMDIQ